MPEWLGLALLLPAGMLAGIVNTLAGGGSFVTLPLLMLTGLPEQLANATNRVAIVAQSAYASHVYERHQPFERRVVGRLLLPLVPGAVLGGVIASLLRPDLFRGVLGIVFVAFAVLMLLQRRQLLGGQAQGRLREPWSSLGLFAIGLYGGFLQAGVGLLLLLLLPRVLGRDLAAANAFKQLLVAIWTIPVLLWFALRGEVAWLAGVLLASGNLVGAKLGTRLAIEKGSPLIFACLIGIMVLTGLRLLWAAAS